MSFFNNKYFIEVDVRFCLIDFKLKRLVFVLVKELSKLMFNSVALVLTNRLKCVKVESVKILDESGKTCLTKLELIWDLKLFTQLNVLGLNKQNCFFKKPIKVEFG